MTKSITLIQNNVILLILLIPCDQSDDTNWTKDLLLLKGTVLMHWAHGVSYCKDNVEKLVNYSIKDIAVQVK